MRTKPIIYMAHPYRSDLGEHAVAKNIFDCIPKARLLWKEGAICIAPCLNTAFMGGQDIPDQVWLDGDLEILDFCDAIYMTGMWQLSSGCMSELSFAYDKGIPRFLENPLLESDLLPPELLRFIEEFGDDD